MNDQSPSRRTIDAQGRVEVETTEDLAEWDYGDYKGLVTKEIRALREERGLNGKDWDHFRDGCEGGEYGSGRLTRLLAADRAAKSPEQVTERLDRLILKIRSLHRPNMHGENPCDVVLVGALAVHEAASRVSKAIPLMRPLRFSGGTWTRSAGIRQTMARISHGMLV